jgi:hypothetical protein
MQEWTDRDSCPGDSYEKVYPQVCKQLREEEKDNYKLQQY